MLEGGDGFGGELVAISFGDCNGGSCGGEGLGEMVAGFGRADEKEGFAGGFREKSFGERLSYI